MANFNLSEHEMMVLRALAEAKEAKVDKINAWYLGGCLEMKPALCFGILKNLRMKELVNCDKGLKFKSVWHVTKNGYDFLTMAVSKPDKPSRQKIIHERKHLGITTTKDTLIITGTSAPTTVTTDTGTSIGLGLKKASVGVDIDSKDAKTIEFETSMRDKKKPKVPKSTEYV